MASVDIAKSFHRQFSGPLDSTFVFNTLNDDGLLVYKQTVNGEEVITTFSTPQDLANYYAKQLIAYSGQIFSVLDPETQEYIAYCVTGEDDIPEERVASLATNFSASLNTVGETDEIPITD